MDDSAQNPQQTNIPSQPQPIPPSMPPPTPFVPSQPTPTTPVPPQQPQASESNIPPSFEQQPPVPPTSHKSKIMLLLLGVVVILIAAFAGIYFMNMSKTTLKQTPTPVAEILTATPTPDPTLTWTTYVNTTHNFSLKYPPTATLEDEKTLGNRPNEDYIVIANQIEVRVTELDPFKCAGVCPIVEEKSEKTTIANLPTTKISGTVKALSGNVAQSLERVVIQNGTKYYIFDLYELERKLTTPAPTNKTPGKIAPDKLLLFNQILSTFKLTQPATPTSQAASTSGSPQ